MQTLRRLLSRQARARRAAPLGLTDKALECPKRHWPLEDALTVPGGGGWPGGTHWTIDQAIAAYVAQHPEVAKDYL